MSSKGFNNPMFSDVMFEQTAEESGSSCSYLGVFGKTLILTLLVIGAAFAAIPLFNKPDILVPALIGALILGMIFALVGRLSVSAAPFCSVAYSICEGLVLGILVAIVEMVASGVGIAAVAATLGVVLVMAILYTTGIVRANQKLKTFVITALLAALLVNGVVLIARACGNTALFDAFYGTSSFALVIAILMIIVAALSLVFDFDYATRLVEYESPKKYEWCAALGLLVGIVYLFIRVLRLFLIIAARRR